MLDEGLNPSGWCVVWGLDEPLFAFSIQKEGLDVNDLDISPQHHRGQSQQSPIDDSVRRYAILHFGFLLSMTDLG
jgi:hypothetical protein